MLCESIMGGVCTYAGVYLSLNGAVRSNNSVIGISEIGNSIDNRLQCITDRMPCCQASPNALSAGNWFFPGDGGGVPSLGSNGATMFGRTRGNDGTVNLYRVSNDVMMPTGQYCCVVPDATGMDQWACVIICKFGN